MSEQKVPIITIDGPSGTGKGTISLMLARSLQWNYLDSGALYRVLVFAAKKKSIALTDVQGMVRLAHNLNLRFAIRDENTASIFLDEDEVSDEIRMEQCGQDASIMASVAEIREALLERQRAFSKLPGLVTDGRDMGTVVFPNAELKIYLHAAAGARAERRFLQLKKKGNDVSLAQVMEELERRDARDTARAHAPLKPATDAVQMDATSLNIEQVYENVLQLVRKRLF